MRITTKQRIVNYLTYRGTVSGSQLEKQADEWFTKPSVISRRARELAQDGRIERFLKGKTVQYKIPQAKMTAFEANGYLEKIRQEEIKEKQGELFNA